MANGVNRYDTPAQAQFINTYVPIPFEEMLKAGQMKQQRYDQAAGAMDQSIAQVENLRAIPDSIDEAYLSTVRDTMYDIRDRYSTKDLSDPMVKRQLNNEIQTKLERDRIRSIQESRAGWERGQQHKQQLIAQGRYNEFLDEDPALDYDSRKGVYNYLTDPSVDRYKIGKDVFGDIKASSMGTRDVDGIREYYRGVGDTKIQEVANTRATTFADTPEGQQLMKLYARSNGLDYDAIQSDDEARRSLAVSTLLDLGEEFKFKELQSATRLPEQRGGRGPGVQGYNPWGLLGDEGSEVENMKNRDIIALEKELDTNIETLQGQLTSMSEEDPNRAGLEFELNKAKANKSDFDYLEAQAEESVDKEYSPKYENLFKDTVDEMMEKGGYETKKEASQALINLMDDPEQLKSAMGLKTLKGSSAAIGNAILGILRGAAGIIETPFAAGAALLESGVVSDLERGDTRAYKEKYNEWKERFLPVGDEWFSNKPITEKEVVIDFGKKLRKLSNEEKDAIVEAKEQSFSTQTRGKYVINVPTTKSKGLYFDYTAGGEEVPSEVMQLVQHIFLNPENFDIVSIDEDTDVGDKDKARLSGYRDKLRVNPRIRLDDDHNYVPIIDIVGEDLDGNIIKSAVRLTERSQIKALADQLDDNFAFAAADAIRSADLARVADSTDFTEGETMSITGPRTQRKMNIKVVGAGDHFKILDANTNEPLYDPYTRAPYIYNSREALKSGLISLRTSVDALPINEE